MGEIAESVQQLVGTDVGIVTTTSDDNRSYHISSAKILREVGFAPQFSTQDAVRDLVDAFRVGKIPDPMTAERYYNIKTMQSLNLK